MVHASQPGTGVGIGFACWYHHRRLL
jgi:hypothetical protein